MAATAEAPGRTAHTVAQEQKPAAQEAASYYGNRWFECLESTVKFTRTPALLH